MKTKEIISTVGSIIVVLGTMLVCKDYDFYPTPAPSPSPSTTASGTINTYWGGSQQVLQPCNATSECSGSLLCVDHICRDTPANIITNPSTNVGEMASKNNNEYCTNNVECKGATVYCINNTCQDNRDAMYHTYKGENFHSVYGITKEEQWYFWSLITYLGYAVYGLCGYSLAVGFHHWVLMPIVMVVCMSLVLVFNRVVAGIWGP